MKCTVIISAGGTGKRFGGSLPKQLVEMQDAPIIAKTIAAFENSDLIDNIVIAINKKWLHETVEIFKNFKFSKVTELIAGGAKRQDSVYNALRSKTAQDSELILVHDAVRPLVGKELIARVVESAEEFGAVVPAIAPTDTIKEVNDKEDVLKTIDRRMVRLAQTPQGFWLDILAPAYEKAREDEFVGTDDASIAEYSGYKVKVVEGELTNIKITTPLDVRIAEAIMKEQNNLI